MPRPYAPRRPSARLARRGARDRLARLLRPAPPAPRPTLHALRDIGEDRPAPAPDPLADERRRLRL